MSLANVFLRGDRAILQADAAATWADGTVGWLGSKLRPVTGLPIVITGTGTLDFDVLDQVILRDRYADPEQFLDRLPKMVKSIERRMRGLALAKPLFCLKLVAYLPSVGRTRAYMIANDDKWFEGQGVAGYELKSVLYSIGTQTTASDLLCREVDPADPASFDVDRDGLKLVLAQRAVPWADFPLGSNPDAVPAVRIGGWVDQAEVTIAGVNIFRLCTWPGDRPGERMVA